MLVTLGHEGFYRSCVRTKFIEIQTVEAATKLSET